MAVTDLASRLALKARLPRAWPAFFERHGAFTPAQLAAMPALLDGANIVLCAPTASGKTEAVMAPLIERHCPPTPRQHPPSTSVRILYLAPTRALVNDLAARLAGPLALLDISLGVKTGDQRAFNARRPPAVLLTTPESLDSLLTTQAATLTQLAAIVIDEAHLFDGTPRGDHLRALLRRIHWLRSYAAGRGNAPDDALQVAAVSATVAQPVALAARYMADARVIQVAGSRALAAERLALGRDDSQALLDYLWSFRAKGWRKALVFCNSRAEVEAHAAATRERSPFGDAVFVHYSNLESRRRREIERQFAAEAAICFASSTLELGIDIGSIDVVILIGPPGDTAAFAQRVGRGNRRRGVVQAVCFHRSPREEAIFDALLAEPDAMADEPPAAFRPAIAAQQIFSLLKQSPTASVRLAELERLFDSLLDGADLRAIVGHLHERDYLSAGRPGEWRAGPALNELLDRQASDQPGLSIHSNIATSPGRRVIIRDQRTQEAVASVDAQWFDRPLLTLEGRPVTVEWDDGAVMLVTSYRGHDIANRLRYRSARQLLSHDLARRLPARLGLPPDAAPFVATPEGWLWFHWLGDLYGRALLDLLRPQQLARPTEQPGLCLRLADPPPVSPSWEREQVARHLEEHAADFEPLLALGPYQRLLPNDVRRRAVVEQFDIDRFLAAVKRLRPQPAPESVRDDLTRLLD